MFMLVDKSHLAIPKLTRVVYNPREDGNANGYDADGKVHVAMIGFMMLTVDDNGKQDGHDH